MQAARGEEAKAQVQLASSLRDTAEAKLKALQADLEQLKKANVKASSDLKAKVRAMRIQ